MTIVSRSLGLLSVAALGVALASTSAHAAGFYLQEQSVSGLGSAFSGSTTNIKDASTVWFNPAAMTDLDGRQVNLGTHLLVPSSKYKDRGSTIFGAPVVGTDGGNPYNPTPLPNIYFATPINDTTWYGLGVNTPFGLAGDYENDFIGRYDSTSTSLTTVNISNVLAHKLSDKLSIGGGIDVQYAHADLSYAASGSPVAPDAFATLNGNNIAFGYNLAVKYKPVPQTEIGASYRSAIVNKLNGTLKIEGTSGAVTPSNNAAHATLDLPDIFALGVTQHLSPQTRVSANATWYGWEKFDAITPVITALGVSPGSIPQRYKNTLGFAIGVEHDLNQKWTVRAGYQYDPTPTQDGFRTTRTPDGDRNWLAGGATYKLNDAMSIDMAAAFIHIGEEDINLTRNSGLAVVNAETEGNVAIVSAALNYKF